MASAGQAHAHSSQPMHFSRPSGQRLSWWRPWNLGAVGRFSSGYSTVSTLLNICRKVTANPLTGLRKSSTGRDLLVGGGRYVLAIAYVFAIAQPVVVRQVERRHGKRGAVFREGVGVGFLPALRRPLGRDVPADRNREQRRDDRAAHQVHPGTSALAPPDPER